MIYVSYVYYLPCSFLYLPLLLYEAGVGFRARKKL